MPWINKGIISLCEEFIANRNKHNW